MATAAENLLTRRDAICAELAAMTSTASGGRPTYNIDGQMVDHAGYKKGLYEELAFIDKQLAGLQAPSEGLYVGTT